MKRPRFVNPYGSEAELCEEFAAAARGRGWEVYPEVHGDLFLVAGPSCTTRIRGGLVPEGAQVVVEAKMACSIGLLRQLADHTHEDCKHRPAAVLGLVPHINPDFQRLALRLGASVTGATSLQWDDDCNTRRWVRRASLEFVRLDAHRLGDMPVPAVRVDGPAGVPSPSGWTEWKESAVRLCLDFEGKTLTSADFKQRGVSITLWRKKRWIVEVGKDGRRLVYRLTDAADRPDRANPEIARLLKAAEVSS